MFHLIPRVLLSDFIVQYSLNSSVSFFVIWDPRSVFWMLSHWIQNKHVLCSSLNLMQCSFYQAFVAHGAKWFFKKIRLIRCWCIGWSFSSILLFWEFINGGEESVLLIILKEFSNTCCYIVPERWIKSNDVSFSSSFVVFFCSIVAILPLTYGLYLGL